MVRAALARGVGFWLLLAGPVALDAVGAPEAGGLVRLAGDIVVGLLSTAAVTWFSLRLLPPSRGRLQLGVLLKLMAHFLLQSMVAGVDVARRAFDPRLPPRPGFVAYSTRIPTTPVVPPSGHSRA